MEILGWVYRGDTKTDINTPEFVYSFLRWALHRDMHQKRIQNQYPYTHTYEHGEIYPDIALISEEIAKKFLLDSIGRYDSLQFKYLDGCIMAIMGDTGTSGVKDVIIEKISKQSDTDIRLEGTLIRYREIEEEICRFDITMTENTDSIWGRYTLKTINSWKWEEK